MGEVGLEDRLRSCWERLEAPLRAEVLAAITEGVLRTLKEDPWYDAFSAGPRVEVLGAADRDRGVQVYFLADHLNYCFAQSGSDWADHTVFAGDLTVDAEHLSPVRIEQVDSTHVSERSWDDGYDREPTCTRARARQWEVIATERARAITR